MPATGTPNHASQPPQPTPKTVVPNRSRKPVQVKSLYPAPPSETARHARALLEHVQTWSSELIGEYVWQSDLKRAYHELCETERWEPRHWTGVGRELGRIAKKIEPKRNGKKVVAYRIPKP